MHAFLVDLENKPGAFATVAEAIAAQGVNITSVSGVTCGGAGRTAIMTSDDVLTRTALGEAKCTYTEMEIIEAALRDEPGALAKATRRLADAGVNIEALLPIRLEGNEAHVGFVASDPVRAREVLTGAGMATR